MPDPITLVATSFEDTLSIPLDLIRNQSWMPSFLLTDDNGDMIDLSNYNLALIIVPVNYDGISIGTAVLLEQNFTILSDGSAQFLIPGTDTGKLAATGAYRWYLESSPPGETDSSVVLAGPLNIWDSPGPIVMPASK